MKVIFLFMSKGSAAPGSIPDDWWMTQKCGRNYEEFTGQCYFKMFESLIENGTITDMKVVFESNVNPGRADFVKGAECWVVPEISIVEKWIDDDTIIFVRGGFKHWHDMLKARVGKNWLICYAANTGRDKWTWWDVVFDDLGMENSIDRHGRYQFPFIKPVNEDIFQPMLDDNEFDICIGASHIHDKKGQYVGIQLMEEFHSLFGYYPTAVMPGSIRRSTHTLEMIQKSVYRNEVTCPGMLTKPELARLYARCKIFLHLSVGGQGDRSILEAHACGLPVALRSPHRLTPLLKPDGVSTMQFTPGGSMTMWANQLKEWLDTYSAKEKFARVQIYHERMGYQEKVIPQLTTFFKNIGGTRPTDEAKLNLWQNFTLTHTTPKTENNKETT